MGVFSSKKKDHSSFSCLFFILVVIFIVILIGSPVNAVSGAAPVAQFDATPVKGISPFSVQFHDDSTGSPTGWAWYFGDETYTEPWALVTPSTGWSPRVGFGCVVILDGSIVVMGGWDGSNYNNDVWWSTDNGTTWTQKIESAGWTPRDRAKIIAMPDGSIVVMGGWDRINYYNDVWLSKDNGETWKQILASAGWSPRSGFGSVLMSDGSIVLMGGTDSSGPKNDVWWSKDNGETWKQILASAGWSPRSGFGSVLMSDGSIVLMGGTDSSGLKNDTWRSMDNGTTWTRLPDAGWSARTSFNGVLMMSDGSIVLMGGTDSGGPKNDTWRSTDNGETWTQLPDAGWAARMGHKSVVMPDGSIVLIGGSPTGIGYYFNDVWRFMPIGSSEQNPSHTYSQPGIYTVSLQAYNDGGYRSVRKVNYITVISKANIITDILTLKKAISDISSTKFKNSNNQKALINKLDTIITYINADQYAVARSKLQNDVLQTTDGCAISGKTDKNDWINYCDTQNVLYPQIQSIINDLTGL